MSSSEYSYFSPKNGTNPLKPVMFLLGSLATKPDLLLELLQIATPACQSFFNFTPTGPTWQCKLSHHLYKKKKKQTINNQPNLHRASLSTSASPQNKQINAPESRQIENMP